jgi:hypothetical protein
MIDTQVSKQVTNVEQVFLRASAYCRMSLGSNRVLEVGDSAYTFRLTHNQAQSDLC